MDRADGWTGLESAKCNLLGANRRPGPPLLPGKRCNGNTLLPITAPRLASARKKGRRSAPELCAVCLAAWRPSVQLVAAVLAEHVVLAHHFKAAVAARQGGSRRCDRRGRWRWNRCWCRNRSHHRRRRWCGHRRWRRSRHRNWRRRWHRCHHRRWSRNWRHHRRGRWRSAARRMGRRLHRQTGSRYRRSGRRHHGGTDWLTGDRRARWHCRRNLGRWRCDHWCGCRCWHRRRRSGKDIHRRCRSGRRGGWHRTGCGLFLAHRWGGGVVRGLAYLVGRLAGFFLGLARFFAGLGNAGLQAGFGTAIAQAIGGQQIDQVVAHEHDLQQQRHDH